jgi:4-alpha-glucanotransferase
MKVLQFAFSKLDDPFLPHHYDRNCVVYTGTHDNDTTRGWWATLNDTDRRRVLDYVGGDPAAPEWGLIRSRTSPSPSARSCRCRTCSASAARRA